MEEWTCYPDDPIMTKEKKITGMSLYFLKKYSFEAGSYHIYQKNPHNRMKV